MECVNAELRTPETSLEPPASCDVLVVGAGPAGSAAATWLARRGIDVVVVDRQPLGRDKTCGDGLTPRAMAEMRRLGLEDWATDRIEIRGLRLRGFGAEHEIPWPAGRFGDRGSAVPRRTLDGKLAETAAEAGATLLPGWGARITGTSAVMGERSDERSARRGMGRFASGGPVQSPESIELSGPDGTGKPRPIEARVVIGADGARSSIGRALGRRWHRDLPYAVAARSYIDSDKHAEPWIGSDLELRDADGRVQPGYGWVFPLGDGTVNLGVGALATDARPAAVNVRELLAAYVPVVREHWGLRGEPRDMASAFLPMGGAVSGIAGPNWALTGDAAALINPLNGEGIDYGLEAGRLLAPLVEEHLAAADPADAPLTRAWPALLREEFGFSFSLARRLAGLLTYPSFLPKAGPLGMGSELLMTAAVRCMGNVVTPDDADLVSALWRGAGRGHRALDKVQGRPLFE
ncbi:geranylgeranyl reductase family protein [Dietzia sp.]|uniref:geranylgeranyl reductase family protein n=1 Tax=Dietzia sp. TaxID=1871616 RepID=UPI003FA5D7B1